MDVKVSQTRRRTFYTSHPLRWLFYLSAILLASYQLCLLIDEYLHTCITLVDVAKPGRLQLPAFTICVPIEEVIMARIAYWNDLPLAEEHVLQFRKAGSAIENYIDQCHATNQDTKRWCALNALSIAGIVTPAQAYHFLLHNTSDYFRFTLAVSPLEIYTLHTPLMTMTSDLCWTYFFKGGVTWGLKDEGLPESNSTSQLHLLDSAVDNFFVMFGAVRYTYAEQEYLTRGRRVSDDGSDWNTIRPLKLEAHSPLERARNRQATILEPDVSLASTFSYAIMDYNDCFTAAEKKCHDYLPLSDQQTNHLTKDQLMQINLTLPMSQADCIIQQAMRDSVEAFDCLSIGVYEGGFTWWDLQNFTSVAHCDSLYGHVLEHGMTMLPFWEQLERDPLIPCPQDCSNLAFNTDIRQIKETGKREFLDRISGESQRSNGTAHQSQGVHIKTELWISPENVPFIRIKRQPSMTGIQFICDMAALFGLWFGWSISSIMDLPSWMTQPMHKLMKSMMQRINSEPSRKTTNSTQVVNLQLLSCPTQMQLTVKQIKKY